MSGSKRLIVILFSVLVGFVMTLGMTVTSFASVDSDMTSAAKNAASKDKYKHTYVIVTSVSGHKTKVFKVNKSKKTVSCVKTSSSCTGSATVKSGKNSYFTMTSYRKKDRDGSYKENGKAVYHQYYMSGYGDKFAIHSVLYKKGSSSTLYHNKTKKIQDSKAPYANNWSNGCTRTLKAFAEYVYNNCGSGTPYVIF